MAMRERLDHLSRDFLWEGCSDKRKRHLMKWNIVILSKPMGGLGFGSLEIKSWVLFAKWWCSFGEEREALWRKLLLPSMGRMTRDGSVVKFLGIEY